MKPIRNISSKKLIKNLRKLDYSVTRQVGSHIRLTTNNNGIHHITIPNHDSIKIGTLSSILSDVAKHFKLTKEELIEKLF